MKWHLSVISSLERSSDPSHRQAMGSLHVHEQHGRGWNNLVLVRLLGLVLQYLQEIMKEAVKMHDFYPLFSTLNVFCTH